MRRSRHASPPKPPLSADVRGAIDNVGQPTAAAAGHERDGHRPRHVTIAHAAAQIPGVSSAIVIQVEARASDSEQSARR